MLANRRYVDQMSSTQCRHCVARCYSQGMATIPTRVDQALFDAAKAAGTLHSRSAAQQLDHWARVGQALEASPQVKHDQIERVLRGQASYDELDSAAQAVVRAQWDAQLAEDLAGADLTAELNASGVPWAEADADGNLVVHDAAAKPA